MPRRHPASSLLAAALALSAALAAAAPRAVDAQTDAGLRVLAIPEGHPIVCTVPAPRPGDPPQFRALVRREFMFALPAAGGRPPGFPVLPPREVIAGWDSSGRPVLLHDNAHALMRGGETVLAFFRPDGAAAGRRVDVAADTARIAAALASGDPARASDPGLMRPPVARDLTPAEGARARALGVWLWARRCRGTA